MSATRPRVDVFVRARGSRDQNVVLSLESVRLRDANKESIELTPRRKRLESNNAERRVELAGGVVRASTYDSVFITISDAMLEQGGVSRPLLLNSAPRTGASAAIDENAGFLTVEVPLRLRVRQNDAASVFIDWDVNASIDGAGNFSPVLAVSSEGRQVILGRMYVTDGATGSLLAIERGTGELLATVGVGSDPRDLAVSNSLRQIFVANARDGSLSVVDLRQNLVTSTLPIRLGAGTWDVAVARRGRVVVAANQLVDSVVFFDTALATKLAEVSVGRKPTRLAVADDLNRVFIVNSLSDELSVIDLNSRSLVGTISVESRPVDVVVDRRERELFVGHKISQNLLVINATTLAIVDSIFIGGDVTAMLADRRRDRVYVARSHPPELAIVDRRLSAIVRRIPLAGTVVSLAQPIEGSVIYGASPELGGVIPIDVLNASQGELILCGQSPTSVGFVD